MDQTQLTEERSPVFLQFLDTVYQLLHQFPMAFQYSEQLLNFLADHLHSGLFGNFLGNSSRQRVEELRVAELTQSIWSYVLDGRNRRRFENPKYAAYPRPIWPTCSVSRMVLWSRYFSRWSPEGHPSFLSGDEWHDDW
jgi:hypothetical protein